MSLEAVIQENTAAMRELIAKLNALGTAAVVADDPKKPAAALVAAKPAPAPAAPVAAPAAAPAPAESPAATAFSHDDAGKLTVKIAQTKGRDAAVALLAKFGAPKATALKADDLVSFCTEANVMLAA